MTVTGPCRRLIFLIGMLLVLALFLLTPYKADAFFSSSEANTVVCRALGFALKPLGLCAQATSSPRYIDSRAGLSLPPVSQVAGLTYSLPTPVSVTNETVVHEHISYVTQGIDKAEFESRLAALAASSQSISPLVRAELDHLRWLIHKSTERQNDVTIRNVDTKIAALDVATSTSGASLWSETGTDITYNLGSVGIGTSSPSATLSVVGATQLEGNLRATGAVRFDSLTGGVLQADANGNLSTTSVGVSLLALTEGYVLRGSSANLAQATSSMFIAPDGRIGIGTVSPTAQLHVSGDLAITETFTTDLSGAGEALDVVLTITPSAGYSDNYNSMSNVVTISGSNALDGSVRGLDLSVSNTNTAVGTFDLYGADIFVENDGTGTNGSVNGALITASANAGVSSQLLGAYIEAGQYGGTVTGDIYGLYLNTAGSPAGNRYGLYEVGGGINYFSGAVGVGTTSPVADFSLDGDAYFDGTVSFIPTDSARAVNFTLTGTQASGPENGLIHIDSSNNTGHALTIYSDLDASVDGALVRIRASSTDFDKPALWIENLSSSGSGSGIRLDGPRPEIEFYELDQIAPAGKFELRVNSDRFQIGTRNAQDSGFEHPFTFYRLADGGRFGIGTSSPRELLTLRASTTQGSNDLFGVYDEPGVLHFLIDDSGDIAVGTSTASANTKFDVWGNVRIGEASTPALFVRTSDNRIGFGTATPNRFFDMYSDAPIIGITDTDTNVLHRFAADNSTGSFNIEVDDTSAGTGSDLNIRIDGVTYVTVEEGGNVGIGDATPDKLLDVEGADAQLVLSESSIDYIRFGVGETASTTVIGFSQENDLLFGEYGSVGDTTLAEMMRLTNAGFLGIGTTTPTEELTVDGDVRLAGRLYDNFNSPGQSGHILQATASGLQWIATSSLGLAGTGLFTDSGATVYLTDSTDALAIGTSSADNATLDVWGNFRVGTSSLPALFVRTRDGRIGFGTDTPGRLVDIVNVSPVIAMTDLDTDALLRLSADTPDASFQIEIDDTNAISGSDMNIQIDGTTYFTFEEGGDFGIGDTTPDQKLDVEGANAQIMVTETATDFLRLGIGETPSTTVLGYADTNALLFGVYAAGSDTSLTEYARFSSTGDFGIGTATLSQKLTVAGNIRVGAGTGLGCIEDYDGTLIGGTCSSDEALKTNIEPLTANSATGVLERLAALTPVTYNWNEAAANAYNKNISVTNTGLIAQDVELLFPELVVEHNGIKQVKFSALPFYIIEAIREMWVKVTQNDAAIASLKDENQNLKARLEAVEAELAIEPAINNDDSAALPAVSEEASAPTEAEPEINADDETNTATGTPETTVSAPSTEEVSDESTDTLMDVAAEAPPEPIETASEDEPVTSEPESAEVVEVVTEVESVPSETDTAADSQPEADTAESEE